MPSSDPKDLKERFGLPVHGEFDRRRPRIAEAEVELMLAPARGPAVEQLAPTGERMMLGLTLGELRQRKSETGRATVTLPDGRDHEVDLEQFVGVADDKRVIVKVKMRYERPPTLPPEILDQLGIEHPEGPGAAP